ncbi:MAG: diaminopimelate decarboxylase [Dysgonamonadaceae bacterium]|jgi:diaminopimelate decarboxylase|nr:diaminopimelate decarboxylase [Dysgonamonadaceae bacterium]
METFFTASDIESFRNIPTPFYYYNTGLLKRTLQAVTGEAARYNYHIHYAIKANANHKILKIIQTSGVGADCVSGGEIQAAIRAGFHTDKIVFAGVGKADWEINLGLDNNISCFNVESIPELEVINELATTKGKTARIALRINPEVDAHTHSHITTGMRENKFGINLDQLSAVLDKLQTLHSLKLIGAHFHIGSQITEPGPFILLCQKVSQINHDLEKRGITLDNINFGGGLGIDYETPDRRLIPDFKTYFESFHRHFPVKPGQQIHFEPGRSIVGQCGALISRVLYIKEGSFKKFVILDAGFTELIRPALYGAGHKIENLTSTETEDVYDVVGPICESSDCFGKDVRLPRTHRRDLIAIRSAGAYGEIMASQYNCRKLPQAILSS